MIIMEKRGQVSEATAFVILVITVTFLIIIYRIFIASGSYESLGIISERHETERLKSGTNALLLMSDEKSGTTMLNLAGIAALLHNDVIYFGPTIGDVNVSEELTWRMNALFEKNHWRPMKGIGEDTLFNRTAYAWCQHKVVLQLPLIRYRGEFSTFDLNESMY